MGQPHEEGYEKTLRDCAEIAERRGKAYGPVRSNFEDIARICDAMFGLKVTPIGIAKIFIATKWSREKHSHQPDNLWDAVNYTAILSHLTDGERE